MAVRKDISIDSDKLAADLGRLDEISERVRLAGYALAAPLVAARESQLKREIARVAARKGRSHPEVAAREAALARNQARFALFREELQRSQLDRPVIKSDNGSGLWGRVAENGTPVEGATVIASAERKRLDFACTDARGGFAIEVPAGVPVVLSVRTKDGAERHRDPSGTVLKPGQQQFREIDLARGAEAPCPEPPAGDSSSAEERFPMVDLVGQREAAAASLLRTLGLRLAARAEDASQGRPGIVVAQKPKAGTAVRRGDDVALVVGAGTEIVVPAVVGLKLEDAAEALKASGLTLGAATRVAVDRERAGLVLEQTPEEGTQIARGGTVTVRVGVMRTVTPPGTSTGPTITPAADPGLVARVARLAEAELRAGGLAADMPAGFVAAQLAEAGVNSGERLDAFLVSDRAQIRRQLGLRTLADTDRAIAALRRARTGTIG